MMATVTAAAAVINLESAVVILQLFDSSEYLVNKRTARNVSPEKIAKKLTH
jgi:hypothetical protein